MAKRFKEIETALLDVFSNVRVSDMEGGEIIATAFVDYPDIEEVQKRVFPSISIMLESMDFDASLEHTDPPTKIFQNGSIITERKPSHWYRLKYFVHAYSLYALQDRDLCRNVENRLAPRDVLTVGDETYWIFRQDFFSLDSIEDERPMYHKVWTFEVLADIDNSETDTTSRVVEEIHLLSHNVKNRSFDGTIRPINEQGVAVEAQNAVKTLHREVRYDDTKFWFPS